MNKALVVFVAGAALASVSMRARADVVRLDSSDRDRLLPLADRLVTEVNHLSQAASAARGPWSRSRTAQPDVANLEEEAIAFRAALRRNRPVDVEQEVTELRDHLTRVEDGLRGRRGTDASLRDSLRNARAALEEIQNQSARFQGAGKADARFEAERFASVDDRTQLATALQDHAQRMQDRAQRTGRSAPAVAHFAEEAQRFATAARRETWAAVDRRPQIERLQGDLNAALREIRRLGADDTLTREWEWCDGVLDRLRQVGTLSAANEDAPSELLGLAHDLQVRLSRAEEVARGQADGLAAFARLGDEAYAFHHEMHDGRLSYADTRNRVENIVRDYRRADQELSGRRLSPEVRAEWQAVRAIIEKMQTVTGA